MSDTVTSVGDAVGVNEAGITLHVDPDGAPLQVRAITPVNPPCGVTAT